MKIILLLFVLLLSIEAETIDQLIAKSLKNNHSLKAIELRLSASDDYIVRSQNLENPNLSLTMNDIQFDDITNRSIEPMQWTAIKVKQKFPWFGKIDARREVKVAEKRVKFHSLQSAKVKLAEAIRLNAYTIYEIDSRIDILKRYERVTKENIDLNTAYTSTQSHRHSGIISAELTLSNIKIGITKLKSIRDIKKADIEYLVQSNIESISVDSSIARPRSLQLYLRQIEKNRDYHIKEAEVTVAKAKSKVEDLSKYIDPYVEVGYFDRRDYNNYASISIGASIPIYGTEHLTAQATHKEALSAQSEAIDYRHKIESQVKALYTRLVESYHIYNIIKNESLPQIEHSFELNSASVQSGGDLFTYIDILKQKLLLDEQLIVAKANYLRVKSRLKSIIGEI